MSGQVANPPTVDMGSIFLGPKGENAEVFERLLLEAFRDHVFWRRNYHPEDGFYIRETEKREPAYEHSVSTLSQQLLGLLAELKAGVPFFSPRYVGHMMSDLTMASMVGYFATMLYNPNNVAAEASPVTTRLELEVAADLARMLGYPEAESWGHLTSGGTVANFEALWAARNVKYLPVAAHWAAQELGISDLSVQLPLGQQVPLGQLDLWQLLNVAPAASLDLVEQLGQRASSQKDALAALRRHSLAGLGYQQYSRRLSLDYGDALPPAVVLVPSTGHYSWEKICHSLGVGSAQLVHVPVDGRFRMDVSALQTTVEQLAARRQPIIACISVLGTTEEGAVDRVDQIAELRRDFAGRLGVAFHLHVDAAWGGYAVSAMRAAAGGLTATADWPAPEVGAALLGVAQSDSVTIDPHKLGFVPYPAGAVSFSDRRVRRLLAIDAPYVFHADAGEDGQIGRFIFEGSKPGAAAAGVWLSHKVLPLNQCGYGALIRQTCLGARTLHHQLAAGDFAPFVVASLPAPDLNVVCFGLGHPRLKSLEATNDFVDRIYRAMSVGLNAATSKPDYFVTRTVLRAAQYGRAALPIVERLGFEDIDYRRVGGLSVIRCTVMNPFLASGRGQVDHVADFLRALRAEMDRNLPS